MEHICSWLKHGFLNTSQLARVMLLYCCESNVLNNGYIWLSLWLVFLHPLLSWDLSPHWWWLTQIYSSPLSSSLLLQHIDSHRLHWMLSLGYLTLWTLSAYVLLCNLSPPACPLFSTFSLLPPQDQSSSSFLSLLSPLISYLPGCIRSTGLVSDRLFDWLTKFIFDWVLKQPALLLLITISTTPQSLCFDPICVYLLVRKRRKLFFNLKG